MRGFLPYVVVTTIVWADKDILKSCQWDAGQGDDLKNHRSTIEINLPRISQRGNTEETAQRMVENWLSIYIVFATRQDLINKEIRGSVSGDAERILYKANYDAIQQSQILKQTYADLAMDNILSGKWCTDQQYKELSSQIRNILLTWRQFSTQCDTLNDKSYLCGKQLLPTNPTPNDLLNYAIEMPRVKVQPSPFIDTLVNVCPNCVPLAKQMGMDAKPFEIETERIY